MKATEQYFPVVLCIMLYKVVQTFDSVYEILKCDYSNESYWEVLFCGTVYYTIHSVTIKGKLRKPSYSNLDWLLFNFKHCRF